MVQNAPSHETNVKKVFGGEWRELEKLGEGGFGSVWLVENIHDKKQAAMKLEDVSEGQSYLKMEVEVLTALRGTKTQFIEASRNKKIRWMACERGGMDLCSVQVEYGVLPDPLVVELSIRCLLAIKSLHEAGYVHRDMKPDNFIRHGDKASPVIYLIDYGIARRFRKRGKQHPKGFAIRPPRETCLRRGTMRYCSLTAHARGEQDDLMSLLYMVLGFNSGLPWAAVEEIEYAVEHRKKQRLTEIISCHTLAPALTPIEHHLKSLQYHDRPDYSMIYEQLKKLGLDEETATHETMDAEFRPNPAKDFPGGLEYVSVSAEQFWIYPNSSPKFVEYGNSGKLHMEIKLNKDFI